MVLCYMELFIPVLSLSYTSLTAWEAQQNSMRVNEAALFYVKQTTTAHTVLFYG